MSLSWMLLLGCASNVIDVGELKQPLAPVDFITISSVEIENQGDVLQIAVIGSQPFSYSIDNHDDPLRITLDVQKAQFVDLPAVLTVNQGGVRDLQFSQVSGQDAMARLEIRLDEKVAYSVLKEQERLFVNIRRNEMTASPPVITAPPQPALPMSPPSTQDYRVGPNDVLAITVYDEPDLSKELRVSGDGFISFPLIGRVQAQGLTTEQIQKRLEHLLSQGYILNPQVSVQVAEYESQKVLVLGAVENPGHIVLRGKATLLELLTQAGGVRHEGSGGQHKFAILLREVVPKDAQGKPLVKEVQTMRIDLERLLTQGDMALNLALQGQDVIYVPQPDSIFVLGEVKNPGPIFLSEGGMTLVEALSKAGGFTKVAAPNRTKVIRDVDGVEQTIPINVADIIKRGDRSKDIVLKANDIVVIPESFF